MKSFTIDGLISNLPLEIYQDYVIFGVDNKLCIFSLLEWSIAFKSGPAIQTKFWVKKGSLFFIEENDSEMGVGKLARITIDGESGKQFSKTYISDSSNIEMIAGVTESELVIIQRIDPTNYSLSLLKFHSPYDLIWKETYQYQIRRDRNSENDTNSLIIYEYTNMGQWFSIQVETGKKIWELSGNRFTEYLPIEKNILLQTQFGLTLLDTQDEKIRWSIIQGEDDFFIDSTIMGAGKIILLYEDQVCELSAFDGTFTWCEGFDNRITIYDDK